ncbi:MAG: YifB family Mg chelatase-like AAA ATPase [Gammaproteobacteria bacterium]|nr:YifB family Mg chelatase-like AAA ATPase [Gammaproteobacteria bacterium]
MQPVTVRCRAPEGARAPEVFVEVHVGPGLPGLSIVGLVETAVKESRDRVRAALQNTGFSMPDRRIVVSLAPADLPKSGSRYDLAIAIGILCASDQLPADRLNGCEFIGELGLSGELRPVPGILPVVMRAAAAEHNAVIPSAAAADAALLGSPRVMLADNLSDACAYLQGMRELPVAPPSTSSTITTGPDLADVAGQSLARRALEIAASGAHHLLLSGPPGTGKSMLAARLPGILPPLEQLSALETAALYSVKGIPADHWPQCTPFRAPHHSASATALAGGGSTPAPGEISLAHNGVLFLDELPEFSRSALEILREPLETGSISIARARSTVTFPARVQLIAAMNPCPCGYRSDPVHECRCTPDQIRRYRARISGPLIDRIDLAVELAREQHNDLFQPSDSEPSATVRNRVLAARQRASDRAHKANAQLDAQELQLHCRPDPAGRALLRDAAQKLGLSRRACNRALRVARTIADLADEPTINANHMAEALNLRPTLHNVDA